MCALRANGQRERLRERERERLSEVDCLTKSKFAPIENVYKCVKCRARALGTLSAEEPKEPKQQRQQLDEQSRVKRTSHSQPDAICMQMSPLLLLQLQVARQPETCCHGGWQMNLFGS